MLSWSVGYFFFPEAPGVTGHELVESPVHRRRKVLSYNISNIQDFSLGGGSLVDALMVRLGLPGPFRPCSTSILLVVLYGWVSVD